MWTICKSSHRRSSLKKMNNMGKYNEMIVDRLFSISLKGDGVMKLNKNLGMILLAVYLIIVGLQGLGVLGGLGVVAALCALAAGILLLINR